MATKVDGRISKAFSLGLRKTRDRIPVESGNYPYVTARLKAKKSLLYPKDMYAKMLQMEIPEIARIIGEGEYKPEVLRMGTRLSGVHLIEAATAENLARIFTQIINFSEGHLKVMVHEYLDRWDVRNIKTIFRAKLYGAPTQEIIDRLVPAGSFTDKFLYELAGMDGMGPIFEALEGTIFDRALNYLGKEPADLTRLAEYEDALSHVYYEELLDAIPPSTFGSRLFRRFVQREIDLLNLKTLLRLWTRGVKLEREVFLYGGLEMTRDDLHAMLAMDQAELINRLSELSFYDEIAEDLGAVREVGVSGLFRKLEKYHLVHAVEQAHLYPLSVIPVLDYIVSKEREVQNLRIIARGKESGLSTEMIKGLLVI